MNIRKNTFRIFTYLLMAGVFMFTACEEELDNSSSVEITADAGNNITASVGEQVTLDGSNSSITEGTLSYLWEFESKPSGSNVTIQNATTVNPTFTPDTEGDYVVKLTVSNDNSSASDKVTVTASGSLSQTQELSGEINSDKTLSDIVSDDSKPDYLVTGGLSINAQLTIEEGVLIHVKEDVGIWVNSEGTLISKGSSGNEVVITSNNESGDIHWKGLFIRSSTSKNSINYTKIDYAGNSEYGDFADFVDLQVGIGLSDGGKVIFKNSTVSNSNGYGMYVRFGTLNEFSGNTFTSNKNPDVGVNIDQANMIDSLTSFDKGVEIFGSTSSSDVSLANLKDNMPYHISGDIFIQNILNINSGVQMFFDEDVKMDIESAGTIKINGTSSDRVLMASEDTSSDIRWKGLFIRSASSQNTISYTDITFAGNSNFGDFADFVDVPAGIGLANDSRLNINNTSISNSGGYGMYVRYGELPTFSGNNFTGNTKAAIGLNATQASNLDGETEFASNGWDGAEIFGSSINSELTWVDLNGSATYHIIQNVDVETGGLTIEAGAKMEFDQDVKLDILQDAYLSAIGTSTNMITFTTSNLSGQIHWKGIRFASPDSRNELDYVTVNYAGGDQHDLSDFKDIKTAISGNNDGELTLTNSTIKNSEDYGVYFQGTINDIESTSANNTFSSNPSGNFY